MNFSFSGHAIAVEETLQTAFFKPYLKLIARICNFPILSYIAVIFKPVLVWYYLKLLPELLLLTNFIIRNMYKANI